MNEDPIIRPSVPRPDIALPADQYLTPELREKSEALHKMAVVTEELADRVYASQKAVRDAMIADIEATRQKIRDGVDAVKAVTDASERKARSEDAKMRAAWNAASAVLRQEYTKFEQAIRGSVDELVELATIKANESGKKQAELANAYMAARPQYLDDLDQLSAMIHLRHHVQWRAQNSGGRTWTGPYLNPQRSEMWFPPERSQITTGRGMLSTFESNELPKLLRSDSTRHIPPEPVKPVLIQSDPFGSKASERRGDRSLNAAVVNGEVVILND